jgi:uracil-DNA glycosylase family 4
MFVGEAPGAEEDRQGLPFVGRAGAFLTDLLEGIGLNREDVFIANVLKCRPPGNRDPQPEEIDSCRPYLEKQVELIQPRVIGTLGNFSTNLMTANRGRDRRVRGALQEHLIGGAGCSCCLHPAAAWTPRVAGSCAKTSADPRTPQATVRTGPLVSDRELEPDQMGPSAAEDADYAASVIAPDAVLPGPRRRGGSRADLGPRRRPRER